MTLASQRNGKSQVSAPELRVVSRPDGQRAEVLDEENRPMSLAGRVRLAFRRDPTKGVVVLLLLLFGLSFLVAGIVVFWDDMVSSLVGLL